MSDTKKIALGFLFITLLASGVVYIALEDTVRVRVDEDKSTFYVMSDSNRWIVSGREYNGLFDGSSKMNRRVAGITINTTIEGDFVKITRTTPYIRGPIIIDEYFFNARTDDVRLFPVEHKVKIINGSGYFYRYEVRDLEYGGPSQSLNTTFHPFGLNMFVEWQEEYRWARVYKSGILKVQYDIPSDYEEYSVRLFDPPTIYLSEDFEDGDQNGWTSNWAIDSGSNMFGTYSIVDSVDFQRAYRSVENDGNVTLTFWSYVPNGGPVNLFGGFINQTSGNPDGLGDAYCTNNWLGSIYSTVHTSSGVVQRQFANLSNNTKYACQITYWKYNNTVAFKVYNESDNNIASTIYDNANVGVNNTQVYFVLSVGFTQNNYVDNITVTSAEESSSVSVGSIADINATWNLGRHFTTINWTTNGSSNSSVEYGTTINLGSFVNDDSSTTNHSIYVGDLSAQTLYYFNVTSCGDVDCNTSGPNNFTTLGPPVNLTILLNGLDQNSSAELNSTVSLVVQAENASFGDNFCVDIDYPGYGENYTCQSYNLFTPIANGSAANEEQFLSGSQVYDDLIWVVGTSDKNTSDARSRSYYKNFTYTGNEYDLYSANTNPSALTHKGDYWYVLDSAVDRVYVYNDSWNATGTEYDFNTTGMTAPYGMEYYNSSWWIADAINDTVFQFYDNFTYTGNSFDISAQESTVFGIAHSGRSWWLVGDGQKVAFQYYNNWTFTGNNFSLYPSLSPSDISFNEDTFYVTYSSPDNISTFGGNDSYIDIDLNLDYFPRDYLNDSSVKNLTFTGGDNNTIYVDAHQYDQVERLTFNLSGFSEGNGLPRNVNLYVNDTLVRTIQQIGEAGSTYELTTLNDSSSSKEINFGTTEVILVGYISVPFGAQLLNATFDFKGSLGTLYQENYDSFVVKNEVDRGFIEVNYTKPANSTSSTIWQVAHGYPGSALNVSIPSECWEANESILMFRMESSYRTISGIAYSAMQCYNGTANNWANLSYDVGSCSGCTGTVSNYLNLIDGHYGTYALFKSVLFGGNVGWVSAAGGSGGNNDDARIFEEGVHWFTTPKNPWMEIGFVNGSRDWEYTGDFNTTDQSTNFSAKLDAYLDTCTPDEQGNCDVPIYMYSEGATINITNISVEYTLDVNPVSINTSIIDFFLLSQTNFTTIPIVINNENNGTISVDAVDYRYRGGNYTVNITAHNADNSVIEDRSLTIYHSRWNYSFPPFVTFFEFIPKNPTAKNVTPYGQTPGIPFFNITGMNYGGKDFNMSFKMIDLANISCVNLSFGNSSNKTESSVLLNDTWQYIINSVEQDEEVGIWMWADYNCNYTSWRTWEPQLYARACAENNVYCDDGVLN